MTPATTPPGSGCVRLLVILVSIMGLAAGGLVVYNHRPLPTITIESHSAMTFKEASAFVVPVGKYQGRTIDAVAETRDGLLWLDWLRGCKDRDAKKLTDFYGDAMGREPFHDALCVYLDDEWISKAVSEAARLPHDAGR